MPQFSLHKMNLCNILQHSGILNILQLAPNTGNILSILQLMLNAQYLEHSSIWKQHTDSILNLLPT